MWSGSLGGCSCWSILSSGFSTTASEASSPPTGVCRGAVCELMAPVTMGRWIAPLASGWLLASYTTCKLIGRRFEWAPVQVLQVYRSLQCALLAGVGLFSMGSLHGQGHSLSGQCSDDMFVAGIIHFFLWYFVADLIIMVSLAHWRADLLVHHAVALTGIISLVSNNLYPCSASPVAVTELISIFSGVEAMLPKPTKRSRGEEHVFYVIRSYRLAVLILIRPFLWQHVRLSSATATSPLQAATYLIPGSVLPLLDLVWSFKIIKSLFPAFTNKCLATLRLANPATSPNKTN